MNAIKHLTQNQLLAYADGSLTQTESRDIGKHLLQCAACRSSLPLPTPQQFFAALMEEREVEGESQIEKPASSPLFFWFSVLFQKPQTLALSGGALVLILGFSVMIWLAAARQSNEEREVAQSFEVENTELKQNEIVEKIVPPPIQTSKTNNQLPSSDSNQAVTGSNPAPSKANSQKRDLRLSSENNSSQNSKGKVLNERKENISTTRGASSKCGEENWVEMEVGSTNKTIVFRWTKVANAAKYHLYISDEEEILIDEYETEQENVYSLKKTLDPVKTYKWKVIITLKNGQTVAGASQKFTVRDIQQNQKKAKKKTSEIRCSENK